MSNLNNFTFNEKTMKASLSSNSLQNKGSFAKTKHKITINNICNNNSKSPFLNNKFHLKNSYLKQLTKSRDISPFRKYKNFVGQNNFNKTPISGSVYGSGGKSGRKSFVNSRRKIKIEGDLLNPSLPKNVLKKPSLSSLNYLSKLSTTNKSLNKFSKFNSNSHLTVKISDSNIKKLGKSNFCFSKYFLCFRRCLCRKNKFKFNEMGSFNRS